MRKEVQQKRRRKDKSSCVRKDKMAPQDLYDKSMEREREREKRADE